MGAAKIKREPFVRTLSENVTIHFGYKDGRALVKVRLPIPFRPWYSVVVPAEAIVRFKEPFDRAYQYGMRPEAERTLESPVEFEARDDCRGRWGYKDAHVDLGVWRLAWIWLEFPFEEFKLAKAAMDEAYMWQALPAHVRELQGAA